MGTIQDYLFDLLENIGMLCILISIAQYTQNTVKLCSRHR